MAVAAVVAVAAVAAVAAVGTPTCSPAHLGCSGQPAHVQMHMLAGWMAGWLAGWLAVGHTPESVTVSRIFPKTGKARERTGTFHRGHFRGAHGPNHVYMYTCACLAGWLAGWMAGWLLGLKP